MKPKPTVIVLFLVVIIPLAFFNTGCNLRQRNKEAALKKTAIDTTAFYPVNSKDTLQPVYFETAKFLWQAYVPKSGQAETEQGELIRSIEKLDREIRDNAKINWNNQFVLLANALKDTLILSNTFPEAIDNEIKNDIDRLIQDKGDLYMNDDIYNRLTRRIVEWYWRHKKPVRHVKDPKLNI